MTTIAEDPQQDRPAAGAAHPDVGRVLVVTNLYPVAARPFFGTFVRTHVEALRARGIETDVLNVPGVVSKAEYGKAAARMFALNAREPYDVVHAFYGLTAVVARLQVRSPLVITFTGGDLLGSKRPDGRPVRSREVRVKVYKATARTAAAIITRTPAMAEALPASLRSRNHVIPHGVDLSRFARVDRTEARRRLGWPLDEPTVIFVADPKRKVKEFPLAEAAVERLRRERPDVRLRVAASVEPHEIPTWMAAADALILSSRMEGSPNVVKEAMAAELPVVSTPVGDVPARLAGIPGCVVADHDPDALAAGLATALDHGRTPQAREAIAPLSLQRSTERVIDVYRSVLDR